MLISVGKKSEYTKEELKSLEVITGYNSTVIKFPKLDDGWYVACAYNQFGVSGMEKMFICQTLEDMNELVCNCNKGGALDISWYTIPEMHFVKTIGEWKKSSEQFKQLQSSSALFKSAPVNSTHSSQHISLEQGNQTGLRSRL